MNEDTTRHLPSEDTKLILAQFEDMNARLTALEERDAACNYDTKPMWEQTLKEIMDTRIEMRDGLKEVRAEIAEVRAEVTEVRAEIRAGFKHVDEHFELIEDKLEIFTSDVMEVRAKQRNLKVRVSQIENELTRQ